MDEHMGRQRPESTPQLPFDDALLQLLSIPDNSSVRALIAPRRENSLSTLCRPDDPIRREACLSCANFLIASAKACASPGFTYKPLLPSSTTCRMTPSMASKTGI